MNTAGRTKIVTGGILGISMLIMTAITDSALALESDRYQPITIQADAAMVDDSAGTSIYRGNVIIEQGTLNVSADEVEIYTADDEVIQIIAKADAESGRLAHYEQETNLNQDRVVADAKKITYLVQEERLHLYGNARLQQVEDVFTGELLYYDIRRGIVNLNSGGKEGDRIKMILTPKKPRQ